MTSAAEINVPASKAHLSRLIDFIICFARKQGFDHQRIWELELVADEVFTNIIDYAYPQKKGNIKVRCRYDHRRGLLMEIEDKGIPFNPLSYCDEESERAKKNGFGIILIRRLIDNIIYERAGGRNCLTLVKRSRVLKAAAEDWTEPVRADS